jgi:hypothetical protein
LGAWRSSSAIPSAGWLRLAGPGRGIHRERSAFRASRAVAADPRNPRELREVLTGWLKDNKWAKGLWGEFELTAREADNGPRARATVRA